MKHPGTIAQLSDTNEVLTSCRATANITKKPSTLVMSNPIVAPITPYLTPIRIAATLNTPCPIVHFTSQEGLSSALMNWPIGEITACAAATIAIRRRKGLLLTWQDALQSVPERNAGPPEVTDDFAQSNWLQ